MEEARYQQLANFMRQRGQKIPGLPFLSLWQFMGGMGTGFAAYVLGLPFWAVFLVGLLAACCFTVYNGEFVGRRLAAIGLVYVLSRGAKGRVTTLEPAWATLVNAAPPPAPATILLSGETGTTVLS
jgi:hypothetical protein